MGLRLRLELGFRFRLARHLVDVAVDLDGGELLVEHVALAHLARVW